MLIIRALKGNDKFSWTLRKNPQTSKDNDGFKELTKTGVYHGYFPLVNGEVNDKEFRIEFKPRLNESVYGELELFPINQVAHPLVFKAGVSALLNSAWKDGYEEDGPTELEFFLYTPKRLKNIIKAFDINVIAQHYNGYHVRQQFPTTHKALNWLIALGYYFEEYLSKDAIVKAAKACNNAGLHYHPRYLISRFTGQQRKFNTDIIKFAGGTTDQQRRTAITSYFGSKTREDEGLNLIDLGAGSLFNIRKVHKLYKTIHAVDYGFNSKAKELAEELDINLYEQTIQDYLSSIDKDFIFNSHILLAEVLEHNSKEEAIQILNNLICKQPKAICVTVPNRSFNVYFNNKEEEEQSFRHEDHKWEPIEDDLYDLLKQLNSQHYMTYVRGIGDTVNQDSISWMITFD